MAANIDSEQASPTGGYDIAVIRPAMRIEQVRRRGADLAPAELRKIKKALRALHNLEMMAISIYRYQITKADSPINTQLIAAMCNEMTHLQDFQVKLLEYGLRPSLLRWAYSLLGFFIGRISRLFGTRVILGSDIWLEAKAVEGYAEFLEAADWDDDTRRVIEKNQADERGHIARWAMLLGRRDAADDT